MWAGLAGASFTRVRWRPALAECLFRTNNLAEPNGPTNRLFDQEFVLAIVDIRHIVKRNVS